MLILDAIRAYVEPIEQRVHLGEVFQDGADSAEYQHAFITHVLRPMLPLRYGLERGKAFSIDDVTTREDSILIYDAIFALPMGRLLPCEGVYAMCEVAPRLDQETFAERLQNVASLKRLHRGKATAHDVTPIHHLGVFGARYAQLSDDKLNPYLGYIFAAEAIAPDVLLQRLNSLIEEDVIRPEHTPDTIVCFRDRWIITRQTRTGDIAVPRSSFAKFGLWRPDSHLMPLLYVLLNASLSQIQLRNPDLLRPLAALTKYKPARPNGR
ncbi:MAG: hypothetical protein CUN48_09285 [Candidatus Thermofonsia Clade 3 bacterium]|uniref:DUF6602 domain-containing protein n=1 Tax=Candidatus Thermofonsia Clade 3 bacterium TaxID=2364212 RepID=A0A2M8QBX9_9CHLR|nr:MAG: hypothetical protein CUN48_09285 [Candidatus Thermofonsia Clade 3 bacterium]